MSGVKIFIYCERGLDPAFWAEPLNALTNAAFVIAGLAALLMAANSPPGSGRVTDLLLSALVIVIGCGSFAFHTLATRTAAVADVAPIGIFMLAYFALALRRFLSLTLIWSGAATLAFALVLWLAPGWLRSAAAGLDFPASQLLRGAAGYLPALVALLGIGLLVAAQGKTRREPTGSRLIWAALVFAVSLSLRALDPVLCDDLIIAGAKTGTHFAWHLLNALMLFLLLRAALVHRRAQARERC